jgi:hypothetical protein
MVAGVTQHRPFDVDTDLKTAGLIAASAAVATILDLGGSTQTEGQSEMRGDIVIDVSAIETDTGDEVYDIVVQGSPDSDFGTDTNIHELAAISLGGDTGKRTDCNKDDVAGRYVLPFTNFAAGTYYRYIRLYTVVTGTIATGINYIAWLSKPE